MHSSLENVVPVVRGWLKKVSVGSLLWYVVMPIVLCLGYWTFLNTLDVDGDWRRLTAITNPIFDWWLYLQILARDALSGMHTLFTGLAYFMIPVLAVVKWLSSFLTWSEIYYLSLVLSLVLSIWLFAKLLKEAAGLGTRQARVYSLTIFLMAQSVIGFRPGASSWYVPEFLVALIAFWAAENAWVNGRVRRALVLDGVALFFTLVYPWYFLFVATSVVMLIALRYLKAAHARIILAAGIVCAFAAILSRNAWLPRLLAAPGIPVLVRGGIGFGHLPIISNTLVAIFFWWAAWFAWIRRSAAQSEPDDQRSKAVALLVMWSALAILWLQNVLTGFPYISDHFVYCVWILSALSWVVWIRLAPAIRGTRFATFSCWLGAGAAAYVAVIVYQIAFKYTLISMGGELIHLANWTFVALALCSTPLGSRGQAMMTRLALAVAVIFTVTGFMGAARFAGQETSDLREYAGFMRWAAASNAPNQDITWCSDWNAEQLLAPNTGLKIFPSTVFLMDPVSTEELQRRLVDVSAFFNTVGSDEGWRYEREILFCTDLLCDINARARVLIQRVVKDEGARTFIIGCDQAAMDRIRADVVAQMKARWAAPMPETSNVCDRFIVRHSLDAYWRIPASYPKLYSDASLTVYGRR